MSDGYQGATRTRKRLVRVIAATLVVCGAAGCHVAVSVHSNPGGVSVTYTPKSSTSP